MHDARKRAEDAKVEEGKKDSIDLLVVERKDWLESNAASKSVLYTAHFSFSSLFPCLR
jgi:hypothetical protein